MHPFEALPTCRQLDALQHAALYWPQVKTKVNITLQSPWGAPRHGFASHHNRFIIDRQIWTDAASTLMHPASRHLSPSLKHMLLFLNNFSLPVVRPSCRVPPVSARYAPHLPASERKKTKTLRHFPWQQLWMTPHFHSYF